MSAQRFNKGRILISLAVAAALVVLAVEMIRPRAPASLQRWPSPNGYIDFLKAGKSVVAMPLLANSPSAWKLEELRDLVSQNVEPLRLVHLGLSRECRVTTDFSTNAATYLGRHMPELASLKELCRVLTAEGRLAELEDRRSDAARSYLDAIRFGQESARGGLMIDKLVGLACEARAEDSLRGLINSLDAKQCREVIEGLELIRRRSESAENVLEQEKFYFRHVSGWRDRYVGFLMSRAMKPAQVNLVQKCRDQARKANVLLLDAAVHAYELEKGERPKSLGELVPSYLKAIPLDPTTGTKLDYPL